MQTLHIQSPQKCTHPVYSNSSHSYYLFAWVKLLIEGISCLRVAFIKCEPMFDGVINPQKLQHRRLAYDDCTLSTAEPPETDSPYYGNLCNVDKWPWSRIIPYSLLYIATSVQWKPSYSELLTQKSHPKEQNQYKFPYENGYSRLTGVKYMKNICCS